MTIEVSVFASVILILTLFSKRLRIAFFCAALLACGLAVILATDCYFEGDREEQLEKAEEAQFYRQAHEHAEAPKACGTRDADVPLAACEKEPQLPGHVRLTSKD